MSDGGARKTKRPVQGPGATQRNKKGRTYFFVAGTKPSNDFVASFTRSI
jgi:hypothetical protein